MVVHACTEFFRSQELQFFRPQSYDTITKKYENGFGKNKSNYGWCCLMKSIEDKEEQKQEKIDLVKKAGFSKICFIGSNSGYYISVLHESKFIPKPNDIIWILEQGDNVKEFCNVVCKVYHRGHKKAKLIKQQLINVNNKQLMKNLSEKTKKDPDFIIFVGFSISVLEDTYRAFSNPNTPLPKRVSHEFKFDKNLIHQCFPFCKITQTPRSDDQFKAALIKARIMGGDKEMEVYDIELKISSSIIFEIDEKEIIKFDVDYLIPFKKSIVFFNLENVKIFVSFIKDKKEINFNNFKNALFILTVDEHGFYDIEVKDLPEIFAVLKDQNSTETQFFDVTYLQELKSKNLIENPIPKETENIIFFVGNAAKNFEKIINTLFIRKIVKIDVKNIESIEEIRGNIGKNDGCILSAIESFQSFEDVVIVFEHIDCYKNDSIKAFLQELLLDRKLIFENFYLPLNECLFVATLEDTYSFITDDKLKEKSTIIFEKDLKSSEFYVVPDHIRDTLSIEAFQQLFGAIRNEKNFIFNISFINKKAMINEINSIFEKSLIKKSITSSDFASIVEAEIEETLLSYPNLHKWASKSTHPTKKILCYAGDAIHFTLLDSENIQLQFLKTNETIILKQNSTNFDPQIPFQCLPNLEFHVHRAFITVNLFKKINQIIEGAFIDFYDKRTFAELSFLFSQEITKNQQKPWECYITNNPKSNIFCPAEFIHYLFPSTAGGHSCSIIVYRQIISPRIKTFHLKHKATIFGTFLNDILQNFGRKALIALVINDKNGLQKSLKEMFQTDAFTILTGFAIEGFEYYKNNFLLKNYVFISCNDISMLAFS